jgi:hypothetical protein
MWAYKSKVLFALNVVSADVQVSECDGFYDVLGPDLGNKKKLISVIDGI